MGKGMEVTKYTEKLVPSTRFVAVDNVAPTVSPESFVAPSAAVIGNVSIGEASSVWYGAIVRGDVNHVKIGNASSIGDRAVVHVAKIQGDAPTVIGNHVTVSAGALVHAATLKDSVVVGEMAQVLDGATVESNSIVAPASIVTPGTTVGSGELWAGAPAKKVRALTEEEKIGIVTLGTFAMV
jgi:gamma-carbonic anhydrase